MKFLGASVYGAAMVREDIDGKALSDLKSKEMKELGWSLGYRKRFLVCTRIRDAQGNLICNGIYLLVQANTCT